MVVTSGPQAWAETVNPPDAGAIIQSQSTRIPAISKPAPELKIQQPSAPASGNGSRVTVKTWKITGTTLFPEEELRPVLKEWLNRPLDFDELWQAGQAVADYYRQKGVLVRAWLPEQDVNEGVVEIRVVEGRFGKVIVENQKKVIRDCQVRQTILAAHPRNQVVRIPQIERGVLLLNDMPGVTAIPYLQPGASFGESDLLLKIEPRPLVSGAISFSNTGVKAVGENQFGASVDLNNAIGVGDRTEFRIQRTDGSVYGMAEYSQPVCNSGLRIGIAGSIFHYDLGSVYKSLKASGDGKMVGIFARYPVLRSYDTNLTFTTGFDIHRYHNTSDVRGPISDKTIDACNFGIQWEHRDNVLGGGRTKLGAVVAFGKLDLFDNQSYYQADQNGPRTNGTYQKITLNGSRLQLLDDRFSMWLNFSGQSSGDKNLDSSEKFSIGGPYGVRAYPVNEALADNAYLLNLELRYSLSRKIQFFGFIDNGGVNLYKQRWTGSGSTIDNYTLSASGLGLNWTDPGNFGVKLTAAQRIGHNPNPSTDGGDVDGSRRTPHLWAEMVKFF
jgi:hemolysin activation/secretion protein